MSLAFEPQQPTSALVKQSTEPATRITGKVRAAIEAMVWLALPRADAAKHAGISEHGLYKALRKAPVRAYYLAELDVLRTSERARNIHTLSEVRDQQSNQMARVAAVKALEQLDDVEVQQRRGSVSAPGLVIQIVTASPHTVDMRDITPKPLIDHDTVSHDGQASPDRGGADR